MNEPSYEIERKFLIAYPNIQTLESDPTCRRIEIVQTYLVSDAGEEARVRMWREKGRTLYFKTVKRKVNRLKRIEIENEIAEDEYLTLLKTADPTKRPLPKTRYGLTYKDQYFEIDVYPFWTDKAVMEIELGNENAPIVFPPHVTVLQEVTDDPSYKNSVLATMI